MAKDPAFLFYPGDYLRDTQNLSEKAQVAYDRIMCEHMRNICITQQQVNFFTKRLNDDERSELFFVLEKKDDGYIIPWVVESICRRRDYSESRRNNRSSPNKLISKTYVSHMENENVIENKKVINIPFEIFWNLYDKKIAKSICEKKWSKLTEEQRELAINHIPKYKLANPDKKYRKDPESYINRETWNDEVLYPENNKPLTEQELYGRI